MSALVNQVNYTPKMPSVKTRHLVTNVTPTNGSSFVNGQDQIILDVGTGSYGQYFCQNESYLRFRITNTNAAAQSLTLDRDCSCLFSRMQVAHSSGILEDISEYGVMNRMFQDCQIDPSKQTCAGSCTRGHAEGTVGSGDTVYEGITLAQNASVTVCMSLLSGIVGPQNPKYLPIGQMGAGGPLRITLTLDNLNNACKAGGANDVSLRIDEVNLVCGIIELDAAGQSMVEASSAGMYAISSVGYRNYTANCGGSNENNVELLVPAKVSSLKAMYAVQRTQSTLNNKTVHSIGCRNTQDMTNYHWSVGGSRYPQGKSVQVSGGDAFEQLMRTFSGINNLSQECDFGRTRFELAQSVQDDNAIATKGAFVAAYEFESFTNDGVESGLNTLGANMIFNAEYNTIAAATHVSFFSVYDTLLTIDGGILTVKF